MLIAELATVESSVKHCQINWLVDFIHYITSLFFRVSHIRAKINDSWALVAEDCQSLSTQGFCDQDLKIHHLRK